MLISTTRPTTLNMRAAIAAYSDRMEDSTGYTIELAYDKREESFSFYLLDPYGDREGDPWYLFTDLVADTEDFIQ